MIFPNELLTFVHNIPCLPGVYRMLDDAGVVLYIGKAKDLSARIKSYCHNKAHSPRIKLMLRQVRQIETTITRNEIDALILEHNLIKSLRPKYNILFRDDKSYPYIRISHHAYPQISYYRGSLCKPDQYFGPYPSSQYMKESIQIIQKIFKLRTCQNTAFNHRSRPCLLFQIQRCSAPCTNEISQSAYQQNVYEAVLFLSGKTDTLIQTLTENMNLASEKLEFELATKYRNKIFSLHKTRNNQFINSQQNNTLNADILSCVNTQNFICMYWISIKNGQYVGDKSFVVDCSKLIDATMSSYIEHFLMQHYLGKEKPDHIITDFKIPKIIQETLIRQHPTTLQFSRHVVGQRKKWLNMAQENARLAIQQKQMGSHHQKNRLGALKSLLNLTTLNRIECFDISHTCGEATIASCVVYEGYSMQPSQYRRYNIRAKTRGDDYLALYEALTRHYKNRGREGVQSYPDIILIDGGKGQITTAIKVLDSLNLNILLVGVAKGATRKVGAEQLIIPFTRQVIRLKSDNPALHLIQAIRDEAHRFAITAHRQKRDNDRKKSTLDQIPLIGAKRKKALLIRFGGLREVKSASVEELMQVEGINEIIATNIHRHLHT